MTSAAEPERTTGLRVLAGLACRGAVLGACAGAVTGLLDALLALWAGDQVVRPEHVADVVAFYAALFAPCGLVAAVVAYGLDWRYRGLALLVAGGAAFFLVAGHLNVALLADFVSLPAFLIDAVVLAAVALWFRRAYHGPGSDEIRWRRWIGGAALAAVIGFALRVAPADAPSAEIQARARAGAVRPNVLLYLADTLRADHLGAYGYERPTSPQIDAFAADAVLFEDFRSTSGWTKPAVASMLTSLYPTSHACVQRRDVLVPEAETLAEVFEAAGWRTGAFSANPWVTPEFGMGQGFQRFSRTEPSVVINGTLLGKAFYTAGLVSLLGRPLRVGGPTEDCRTIHTEGFLPWLDEVGDDPWLAYVHVMEPHMPYDPPRASAEAVGFPRGEPFVEVPDFDGILPFQRAPDPDPALHAKVVAQYDGEIRDLSSAFGELLDELGRRGVLEDTIVVFLSDHGEEFHEHGGWRHGHSLHPELLRVPLVVRLPASLGPAAVAGRGRRVGGTASILDVFPTLIDLCEIRYPKGDGPGRTGLSLVAQLRGEPGRGPLGRVPDDRTLLAELAVGPIELRSIRQDRWHYIRSETPFELAEALYDEVSDPGEERDQAERDVATAVALRAELDATFAALAALALRGAEREVDAETAARLEALGYVGGK